MRRANAILVVLFCAVTGCRGTGAQEPYDGLVAAARRPSKALPAPAARAPEAQPIASEVDVPWTIALLSDAKAPRPKRSGKLVVVDREAEATVATAHDAGVYVAAGPHPLDDKSTAEKPAAPKSCSGVVNRRS
jgi:glucose/arabinose dehydrogenase